jgi:hypothetical protein
MGDWARERYGYGWRGPKRAPEIQEKIDLGDWLPSTPAEFARRIEILAERLGEPRIHMSSRPMPYEDGYEQFPEMAGWRLATREEIAEAEAKRAEREETNAMYLDNVERTLRASRPELFKDAEVK